VELSEWHSLEAPGFKRYIPGQSLALMSRRRQRVSRFLGRFGIPVERAYDCVTIGRKADTN